MNNKPHKDFKGYFGDVSSDTLKEYIKMHLYTIFFLKWVKLRKEKIDMISGASRDASLDT